MSSPEIKTRRKWSTLLLVPIGLVGMLLFYGAFLFWAFVPIMYEYTEPAARNQGHLLFFTICGGAYILFFLLVRVQMNREPEGAFWARLVHEHVRDVNRKLLKAKRRKKASDRKKDHRGLLAGIKPVVPRQRTRTRFIFDTALGSLLLLLPVSMMFFAFFVGLMNTLIEFGLIQYRGSVTLFVMDAMLKGMALDLFESFDLDFYAIETITRSVQSLEFIIRTLTSFAVIGFLFALWSQARRGSIRQKYAQKPETLFQILEGEYRHAVESPVTELLDETVIVIERTVIPYYRQIYLEQVLESPKNALEDMVHTNVRLPESLDSQASPSVNSDHAPSIEQ